MNNSQGSLDQASLRAMAEKLALQFAASRGRAGDNPPLFCSEIPADQTRNVGDFSTQRVLCLSVGGTWTHIRAFELGGGIGVRSMSLGEDLEKRMPTPGTQTAIETLEQMVAEISTSIGNWLRTLGQVDHMVISWGFPQIPLYIAPDLGYSDASALPMTKHHQGIETAGEAIGALFRQALPNLSMTTKITVQNDVILAMQRYVEPVRMANYRHAALMILGTGCNLTTAEPYLVEGGSRYLIRDDRGMPIRAATTTVSDSSTRRFWVNYELGQTRGILEDQDDRVIEDLGLAGVSWPWVFERKLLELPWGEQVWRELHSSSRGMTAEKIAEFSVSQKGITDRKSLTWLHPTELQLLAREVITQSAELAAAILAGVSLFSGLGLETGSKPDMLAMEGSLWKVPGYQQAVKTCWQSLLTPELKRGETSSLSVDFVSLDGFNSSVLGSAYLIGYLSE